MQVTQTQIHTHRQTDRQTDRHTHEFRNHELNLQINREDKTTGYFPLFEARSLREKKDDTLTELGELKKMVSMMLEYHQEMVDIFYTMV